MGCVLVDFDSGQIVHGLIQFWVRSFKSKSFFTMLSTLLRVNPFYIHYKNNSLIKDSNLVGGGRVQDKEYNFFEMEVKIILNDRTEHRI